MYSGRTLTTTLAGVGLALVAVLLGPLSGVVPGQRADGADTEKCARFALQSAARARVVTGQGPAIAVLGDSYSVGLGLRDPALSWPARLPGRTRVLGFSGSGFSASASPCRGAAFAQRVPRAAAAARTVVVEGGLNDFDQSEAAIRAGVRRVLHVLENRRVLVVGPVAAPSRAGAVGRVDRILAAECSRAGVAYLSTRDLQLPYLPDRLHLTAAGHRVLGDLVSRELRSLR